MERVYSKVCGKRVLSTALAVLFLSDFVAVLKDHPAPRFGDQVSRFVWACIARDLSAANGARGLLRQNLLDTPMGQCAPQRHIRANLQMRHAHPLALEEDASMSN